MSSALAFVLLVTLLAVTSRTISASSSSTHNDVDAPESSQLEEVVSGHESRLLKRSLRDALQQHFELLREAEEDILQRIEALKAKRQAISQRKRSHYMCLVNLIACYK